MISILDLYDKAERTHNNTGRQLAKDIAAAIFKTLPGWTLFDQECDLAPGEDESDHPLFEIVTDKDGVAVREFLSDRHTEPLFQEDVYDRLIVGMAEETLDEIY